jgi:hypothetical protein
MKGQKMSLEKKITVECVEVFANGVVYVRSEIGIFEDQKQISTSSNRKAIYPGDDFSQEDALTQSICSAVHTPEQIAAYQAQQAEASAKSGE